MLELFDDIEGVMRGLDRAIVLGALVVARIVPIVQLVPYLGGKAVPQTVKLGLSMAVAVIVYPAVWTSGAAAALPESPFALAALAFKEVLVGMTIGFVAALVFEAVRMAGQMIDSARGQTQATAMVPQLPERVSVSAELGYQLAVVIFLVAGGHRIFLAGLVRSFGWIPPQTIPALGGGRLDALVEAIVRMTADAITLAVLLSFPVVAAILLANLFLALVNKAAPQINVFFLGMPIKAVLGVAVLLLSLQVLLERIADEALVQLDALLDILRLLGATQPP
jgi:flagellar biosynthetic protein FliR